MFQRFLIPILIATQACRTPPPATPVEAATTPPGTLDEVTLLDGQKINGRVMFESEVLVVVGQRNGTFTLKKSDISAVRRGAATREMKQGLARSERLPPFNDMLAAVAREPWVKDLSQVPATVIGVGELRNIPYVSHKAGNIEFNVYGDPEHPAAVEVGVYDTSPDEQTRERLRTFVVGLLPNADDKAAVQALGLDDDDKERDGLTFDVDPPTAADSFGGWWLTVYDKAALNQARATDDELKQLATSAASAQPSSFDSSSWSSLDYSHSSRRSSGSSSSSGGAVYVRGYTRKDGTYVRPHTRSAPRSRRR